LRRLRATPWSSANRNAAAFRYALPTQKQSAPFGTAHSVFVASADAGFTCGDKLRGGFRNGWRNLGYAFLGDVVFDEPQ
jgi:hypothetical protein